MSDVGGGGGPSGRPWYIVPVQVSIPHAASRTSWEFMQIPNGTYSRPPQGAIGPFGTQAAAQAYWHQHGLQTPQQVKHSETTGPNLSLPNPLAGIDEIGAVLKAFFTTVTDWHFWASLGWILLGLVLMAAGIRLWLGKPLLPKMPAAVPVPV